MHKSVKTQYISKTHFSYLPYQLVVIAIDQYDFIIISADVCEKKVCRERDEMKFHLSIYSPTDY